MKTRENKAMRFASVLLVLTLLATSLTAGTFAKYTTEAKGEGKARVAKFGVDVSVDATNVFGKKYKDSAGANGVAGDSETTGITVEANDMVVAPGTKGEMTFSVKGTPETYVAFNIDLKDGFKEIMLPDGTYENGAETVELQEVYYPVKWKLTKGSEILKEDATLTEIDTYFATITRGAYAPSEFNKVVGDYTLSWEWKISDTSITTDIDIADTILGDLQEGTQGITKDGEVLNSTDYTLNEEFTLTISVEQVD